MLKKADRKDLLQIKVFARLFQKAARAVGGDGRAPQSAKSPVGVFFFVAFSFAAAMAKEKADRAGVFFFWLLAHLGFYLVGRELTDLRSKLGRRRRDRVGLAAAG